MCVGLPNVVVSFPPRTRRLQANVGRFVLLSSLLTNAPAVGQAE
jgi:hypothetical protein